MIGFIRRLTKDRRGNALAIAGAALPLLVGAAGLATDTIQWTLWKRQLQRAADSAAIAGVYTRLKNDNEDAVNTAVDTDLDLNDHTGITLDPDSPLVELLGDDGDMKKQVRVTLELSKPLPFSSMFMTAAPVIRAVATAASVPGADEYCVIALDPSVGIVGIEIAGSTDIDLGDCSLIADSTNPNKAASNGTSSANGGQGSKVTAKSLAAAGGVNYSSNWNVKSYDPYSPPIADPYAGKYPIPTSSTQCSKTASLNKTNGNNGNGGNVDLSADPKGSIVCLNGSQTIQGTVKLGPATYVINGGDLTMNATGTSLSCTGCTIILTDFNDPTKTGSIKLTGGTLNISAPTEDGATYKGLAIYQDPKAKYDSKVNNQNHINGNSGAAVEGAIYMPSQSLLYNGGGKDTSVCLQVVASRVTFSGSSKIKVSNQCTDKLPGVIGGGRRVRLVA